MAFYLDIRTAITSCEQALVDALDLGYRARHPAVADLPSLRALPSIPAPGSGGGDVIPPQSLRFVTTEGVVYRWRKFSANSDASPYVIVPNDRPGSARGRWERCASSMTFGPNFYRPLHREPTGYARAVQLWQGDEGYEQAIDRIYAQSPAMLVRFIDDNLTMRANHPRGLNEYDLTFQVWCFARNLRNEEEALEGSLEPGEEPGLFRMMGDVRYLLAGTTLGLDPAVRYVDIQGPGSIVEENLQERRFAGTVMITVKCGLNIPDEDLSPLDEVWVQFQDAHTAGRVADPANVVMQGYRLNFGAGIGLSQAPSPGVAYVAGKLVTSQPGVRTFTASVDTYRYLLQDGSMFYAETAPGADPPSPAFTGGVLLLGKTTTNATDIVWDGLVCDYLNNEGDQFRAL